MLNKALVSFLCLILLAGCGSLKNSGNTYLGENKYFGKQYRYYKTHKQIVEEGEPNLELGISIMPHIEGMIRGIRIKTPQQGYTIIRIWDAISKDIIQELPISITDTANYTLVRTEVPMYAGKPLCITYNTRSYYYHSLQLDPLPYRRDAVSLLASVYAEGKFPRFPEATVADVYHGLIDIDVDWKIN